MGTTRPNALRFARGEFLGHHILPVFPGVGARMAVPCGVKDCRAETLYDGAWRAACELLPYAGRSRGQRLCAAHPDEQVRRPLAMNDIAGPDLADLTDVRGGTL